jgi:hypothetical protein
MLYLDSAMSGKIYFEALDSKGDLALWVSNGTAAGTYEVGGGGNAGVTGAGGTGLTPNNLIGFGGNSMFWSTDSNDALSLWSTDGTVSRAPRKWASRTPVCLAALSAPRFSATPQPAI